MRGLNWQIAQFVALRSLGFVRINLRLAVLPNYVRFGALNSGSVRFRSYLRFRIVNFGLLLVIFVFRNRFIRSNSHTLNIDKVTNTIFAFRRRYNLISHSYYPIIRH